MFAAERRGAMIRLALIALIVALSVLAAACGGDDSDTATSTAPTQTVSTSAIGDPTTTAPPATTVASTPATEGTTTTAAAPGSTATTATPTTAAPSTATTAKPTSTTAKATTTTAKPVTTTAAPTTTTVASGPVVLKLSGPSGTKTFAMAELKALPAVSGYGGWKNSVGNITAPVAWKGPSLNSLMKLVGGGSSISVVASDGYTSTVVPGASMNMYDPATGAAITGISVTAILAYSKNGGALGGDEGPLRICFVSPEKNQVTDGSEWARMVVELKVK